MGVSGERSRGYAKRQKRPRGGCVVVRQRPGTAKGIVFLSVEDETGIFNVIVMPDVFKASRLKDCEVTLCAGRVAGPEIRRRDPC